MESPELTCKKIANKLLWFLSKEFHIHKVDFVEDGESLSSLKGASVVSVSLSNPLRVEGAVQELLTKVPHGIEESVELLVPPNIAGVVVTACNISIRVLKNPQEDSFLITFCWK